MSGPVPAPNCPLCPRLVRFREATRRRHPDWHNAPVPAFGRTDARLLIVGLAPGLKGANRTGRPFTGDAAGELLYGTLVRFGLAKGQYGARVQDGLELADCRITNAVRCVPPENRATGAEIATCRRFLEAELAALPRLKAILALGGVAHRAVVMALGLSPAALPFRHGASYPLSGGRLLADSYHCSRYNLNTGRLTEAMFHAVFAALRAWLDAAA